jgi:HTH-type transcriptional regulator, quorum sensing regulator NprR
MTLSERIKQLRKEKKITQEDLAKGICSRPYLNMIEKGKVYPSPDLLNKIAERLGTTPKYLQQEDSLDFEDIFSKLLLLIDEDNYSAVVRELDELSQVYIPAPFNPYLTWIKGKLEECHHQNIEAAIQLYETSYELAVAENNAEIQVRSMDSLAFLYLKSIGDTSKSGEYLNLASEYIQRNIISFNARISVLINLGWQAIRENEPRSAIRYLREAGQIIEQVNTPYRSESLYMAMGVAHDILALYPEAEYYFNRCLEIIQTNKPNDHSLLGAIYGNLAVSYRNSGRLQDSITMHELSVTHLKIVNHRFGLENRLVENAITNKMMGETSKAVEQLRDVIANGLPLTSAEARCFLAEILLESNQCQEAVVLLEESISTLEKLNTCLYLAKGYSLLAKAYRQLGEFEKAFEMYEKATSLLS